MSEEPGQDATETPDAETPGKTGEAGQPGPVAFPYAAAGAAFTNWFNERVRRLTSPTVMLGTKRASVFARLEDGRLECEVETEALEPERQFVAFEARYLDPLIRKITALGL